MHARAVSLVVNLTARPCSLGKHRAAGIVLVPLPATLGAILPVACGLAVELNVPLQGERAVFRFGQLALKIGDAFLCARKLSAQGLNRVKF
jgi:hypothetical protein